MRGAAIAIAALACLCSPAAALDPRRPMATYQHTRWGQAEGAPLFITAINQDRHGYLIIGAMSGLYRFDGVTFELIRPEDKELNEGRVLQLVRARDDTIWAFYDTGEIATYRDGKLRRDSTNLSVRPRLPASAVQTADGDLWMDGNATGAALLRRHNGVWQRVPAQAGIAATEWANYLLATRDGSLWVSTNHMLFVKRKGSARFDPVRPATLRTLLSEDGGGRIWVSDHHGTVALDASGKAVGQPYPTPGFDAFNVSSLFDRDGSLWLANGQEIARVRTPGRTLRAPGGQVLPVTERLGAREGLGANTSMFEDRDGNIWVGTARGLNRFRDVPIVAEPVLATSTAGSLINLFAASDGTVYMAVGKTLFRARPGAAPERVTHLAGNTDCLTETGDGAIWVIEFDRFVRYYKGLAKEVMRSQDLALRGVYDEGGCAGTNDNTALVSRWYPGNPASGIMAFRGNGLQFHPTTASNWPVALVRGPDGTPIAWLENGDVARLGADYKPATVLARSVPKSITHMLMPGSKGPFLGGGFGLARIAHDRLQLVDAKRFPWLASPTGIAESPDGRTWLLTPAGIVVVKSANLDHAFDSASAPLPSRVLNYEDGLPEMRSPGARTGVARGGDGRIWFATFAGVVWIDPAEFRQDTPPPPVHIGTLTVGSQVFRDPPSAITLASGTSRLAIRYAGLDLSLPSNIRFRYRLQGVDPGWIDAGTRREAFYTNLGAGTYQFDVIASNADGVWSEKPATIAVTILPAFYEQLWFRILCVVALGSVLWFVVQARTKALRKRMQDRFDIRNAERERIARALHDTLLQSVQAMVLRFQSVADSTPLPATDRQRIEEALDQADALIYEGRNQVQALRIAADRPATTDTLRHALTRLRQGDLPSLQVVVSGEERVLRAGVSAELVGIAEEAVRNAFRHAGASSIEISLVIDHDAVTLRVTDDGVGIAPEIVEAGREGHYGLLGMRERAQQLRGTFHVARRPGGGTEILVKVPGRSAFQAARFDPLGSLARTWRKWRTPRAD